uniref:Peptidase S1 domain-containing protein n=1 Tax=Myripristis murdjan TaxID=586833 RepID=A0A667ZBQ4_9TELE
MHQQPIRATESGIVGGKTAKPHSRPYMVSLQVQGHHRCGGILIRNDFVLTSLKTNATLNKYVKTVGLPKKNGKIPANIKCYAAGWGQTGPNKPGSDVLKEVMVKLQFDQECSHKWQNYFSSDQMMCVHSDKRKEGICQGDSGGPLLCRKMPQGISAYTKASGCDDTKYPHVFMKINFFSQWIKNVMQG